MQDIQMKHFQYMNRFFDAQHSLSGKTEYIPKALTVADVNGAFWLLLAMELLSFVVFGIELLYYRMINWV